MSNRREPKQTREINAALQIDLLAQMSDARFDVNRAAEQADVLMERIAAQKANLDRVGRVLHTAIDECTCGGVARAISQHSKGEHDEGSVGSPGDDGHGG